MIDQLLYLFITFFLSAIFYPMWIKFVYRYHMGEEIRSEGPESHLKKKGTPTMGGFVFLVVVAVVTLVLNRSRTQTLLPIFVACLAGLLGMYEDFAKIYKTSGLRELVRGQIVPALFLGKITGKFGSRVYNIFLKPWDIFKEFWRVIGSRSDGGMQSYQKFLIQASIAGFVSLWAYFKLGWDYIWFPLIGDVHIGFLYPIVIFFLFILFLNTVAITDGLDGLAGGLGAISFTAFWVIASQLGFNDLASLCASFVGALLPFLYFNIFPARLFMGNVGSHVLGAVLTILAVVMHREIILFFVCGMFFLDGISSPLQQLSVKLTKKRLFKMAPIHHHFEIIGWPETKVTMRFWLFGIVFALFGIFVSLL